MASMHINPQDDYVDVDELISSYQRRKTTIMFLIAAIALIFYGTISGYSALQYKTAKVETLYSTTLELAPVTANSEYCVANPGDSTCIKAKEIVADPKKAGISVTDENPAGPTEAYDFESDPATQIVAAILSQPLIRRVQ